MGEAKRKEEEIYVSMKFRGKKYHKKAKFDTNDLKSVYRECEALGLGLTMRTLVICDPNYKSLKEYR